MSERTPDDDRPDETVAETDEIVETHEERVEGDADGTDDAPADDELADVAENEAELEAESELNSDESDDDESDDEGSDVDIDALDDDADAHDDADAPDDSDAPADGEERRGPEPDALVSRLRLIGEQPLDERAASLSQLHDELRARLESGDPSRR